MTTKVAEALFVAVDNSDFQGSSCKAKTRQLIKYEESFALTDIFIGNNKNVNIGMFTLLSATIECHINKICDMLPPWVDFECFASFVVFVLNIFFFHCVCTLLFISVIMKMIC